MLLSVESAEFHTENAFSQQYSKFLFAVMYWDWSFLLLEVYLQQQTYIESENAMKSPHQTILNKQNGWSWIQTSKRTP